MQRKPRTRGNGMPWQKGGALAALVAFAIGGTCLASRPTELPVASPAPASPAEGSSAARTGMKEIRHALVPSTEPGRPADHPRLHRPARAAKSPPATPERARYLAESWVQSAIRYDGANRAELLDGLVDSLVQEGAPAVAELARVLGKTSVYEAPARAAIFHALGRVGASLAGSNEPEAQAALGEIHRIAEGELALPELMPPDPELHVETLSPAERDELVHHGPLMRKDGEYAQPTLLNKLSVIGMLRVVGNEASMKQLLSLKEINRLPAVQFAVDQAFAVAMP